MKRRAFIAGLGSVAALPVVARAQQAMPVIGYLSTGAPDVSAPYLAGFHKGLSQTGYVAGKNVTVEYRWGRGDFNIMPELIDDLINRRVNVLVTGGSTILAKARATTIPIVSLFAGDPVKAGYVASFNKPGGTITGVAMFAFTLGPKRFELLRELVPKADAIFVLANPAYQSDAANADLAEVKDVARAAGQQLDIVTASNERELDLAFTQMAERGARALLVMANPFFNNRREQIVGLATRMAIPAIYEWRQFVEIGGLMSYGASLTDTQRQMGIYAGKILQGANPADLPVMQAVKVELVLNLNTAKALGVTFPITLLGRADEVIE